MALHRVLNANSDLNILVVARFLSFMDSQEETYWILGLRIVETK